jgi:DNA repair exonuclease SbcCD ATPase subunit
MGLLSILTGRKPATAAANTAHTNAKPNASAAAGNRQRQSHTPNHKTARQAQTAGVKANAAAAAKPAATKEHKNTPAPDQAQQLRSAVAVAEKPAENAANGTTPKAQRGFALADDAHTRNDREPDHELVRNGDAEFKPLRNKQELFEELQKNYREVVQLVRKVDTHLDEDADRSRKLADIADRVDRTLPSIEKLGETPARIDALRTELTTILKQTRDNADQRAAKIEKAVGGVVQRLEAQQHEQQRLVSTMAEFRETMGELASSTRESGSAVRELARSVRERDQTLSKQIGSVRTRLTIGLSAIGLLSAAAVAIAASSLTG